MKICPALPDTALIFAGQRGLLLRARTPWLSAGPRGRNMDALLGVVVAASPELRLTLGGSA